MSMTREEAIEILRDTPIDIRSTRDDDIYTLYATAHMMALAALCGPTREMVERMRGEWVEDDYSISRCSLCGYEQEEPELITPFCPNCGAPMTDEAVDILWKRWKEAVEMERLEA